MAKNIKSKQLWEMRFRKVTSTAQLFLASEKQGSDLNQVTISAVLFIVHHIVTRDCKFHQQRDNVWFATIYSLPGI